MDHTSHIQIGPGVIYIPLKELDVLINPTPRPYVQRRRHIPCRVPHLDPHAPCAICSHTHLYLRTSPLSARLHVLCQRHMPCRVSHLNPHAPCAICLHSDPYAQPRGSALVPLVTPILQNCVPQTSRGHLSVYIYTNMESNVFVVLHGIQHRNDRPLGP